MSYNCLLTLIWGGKAHALCRISVSLLNKAFKTRPRTAQKGGGAYTYFEMQMSYLKHRRDKKHKLLNERLLYVKKNYKIEMS